MRPEHLRELVAVRDRRTANTLLSAIGRFVDVAAAGELCDAARWITASRLIFLRKKKSATPRPIRVGEVWRRLIAKRLIHAHRTGIQQFCLDARQFGVALPGGSDALVHFRLLAEREFAAAGEAVAAVDVDFRNCFPSLEWDSIREEVRQFFRASRHGLIGATLLPAGCSCLLVPVHSLIVARNRAIR